VNGSKARGNFQVCFGPIDLREVVNPMAQSGSHHQDSPLVRSSSKRPFEASAQEMDGSPPPSHQNPTTHLASASAGSSTPSNGAPAKKRITRKRAIMSCRNCTARKIRCERDSGPGLPCRACTKRGEGALCDPGSTPGASSASTS